MAELENAGFNDPGARLGQAASWLVRSSAFARARAAWQALEAVSPLAAPNDFTAGSWNASAVTVNANAAAAPDGSTTADRLRASALNVKHFVRENADRSFEADKTYTFGCFLKKENVAHPNAGIRLADTGSDVWVAKLGMTTTDAQVEFVSPPSGSVAAISAEAIRFPNGWTLLAMSITASGDFDGRFGVGVYSGVTTATEEFTGANTGPLAWGAFVYEGSLEDVDSFTWNTFLANIPEDARVAATYPDGTVFPKARDDIEYWVVPYYRTIPGAVACFFDPDVAEGFEEGWTPPPQELVTSLDGIKQLATFSTDVNDFEDFGTEWFPPIYIYAYAYTIPSPIQVSATFQTPSIGAQPYENFEGVHEDILVDLDVGTGVFTAVAHGLPSSAPVVFYAPDGDVPDPAVERVAVYWTSSVTTDTFKLGKASVGPAMSFTDAGNGAIYVRPHESRFWNTPTLMGI